MRSFIRGFAIALIGLIALVSSVPSPVLAAPAPEIDSERRTLLVFSRDLDDPRLAEQQRLMHSARADADKRDSRLDVAVVPVVGTGERELAIRSRLGIPPRLGFAAVLIEKDGRVALRSNEIVEVDELAR